MRYCTCETFRSLNREATGKLVPNAMEFLISKGANPELKTQTGWTPVQMAKHTGGREVWQILQHACTRRAATPRHAEANSVVPLKQQEALARAAEDALLAELEAEEAEAAAKRKAKKKGKKKGKEAELASVMAALEDVRVGEEEGGGGKKIGKR